ncbi:MAG: gamma-glutamylcyclotransferase family protein [Acetobacteraceae bacterium]
MRLFFYGTLLDPAVLSRRGGFVPRRPGIPATLRGWQRVTLKGTRYPTLRPGKCVTGVLHDIGSAVLGRLTAYEGPRYHLMRVVVATPSGKSAAWTWIASAATRRPWEG